MVAREEASLWLKNAVWPWSSPSTTVDTASPSRGLALTRPDHALLLKIWPRVRSQVIERNAAELAEVLREKLVAELGLGRAALCWVGVGVGGPRPRLTEAHLSYEEARRAAEVARITGTLGCTSCFQTPGTVGWLKPCACISITPAMPSMPPPPCMSTAPLEQLTGLRLDVGDDRLAAHLALKMAELHPVLSASTKAPDAPDVVL
ncbi:hypothetical protein OG501_01525 [Streptomyces niveus]|uniref:hypothetical protein n=1 Tax=Streptomyces niveus TaxID=193462 RepID=UPI00386ED798